MNEKPRITLEKVIDLIGDEIGKKYTWFLLGFDAQGVIDGELSNGNIRKIISSEHLGYCEVSWSFVKDISKKLSAVVEFFLVGAISAEDFLQRKKEISDKAEHWVDNVNELEFSIYDGEIWEITGTDRFLVKRLQKTFSPLPILLM